MKPLAKIAAIVASVALAASALGCSSGSSSPQGADPGFQPQDIQVNEPGFAITDEGKLRYAFVAVNPNEGHVAQDVIFTVEAYDAKGSMIAGGGETIATLYPGIETAGSGEADLFSADTATPEVASLSIVPMMDSVSWTDTALAAGDVEGAFEIVSPRMAEGDDGSLTITASVERNAGDAALAQGKDVELRAVALLFDEAGSAVCGTFPMTLKLGADADSCDFSEVIQNAPAYAECNLYVTPITLL